MRAFLHEWPTSTATADLAGSLRRFTGGGYSLRPPGRPAPYAPCSWSVPPLRTAAAIERQPGAGAELLLGVDCERHDVDGVVRAQAWVVLVECGVEFYDVREPVALGVLLVEFSARCGVH